MKIQTKITLFFFIIATVGLMLLNASIFYFVSEFSFEDFFKRLEARVNLAAEIKINPDSKSAAYQEVRSKYLEKLEQEKDYIIPVNHLKDNTFIKPLPLPDQFYQSIIKVGKARYNENNHFYVGAFFKKDNASYIVIVAAEDPYGFKELEQLKKVLLIIFFISIVLTYIAGKIFSWYIIQPVTTIINRVKTITANNLNSRLTELKGKDEIAELVLTFNNMLTRLETSFETQNNFVSNASHELRTPLTIITSEAEILLNSTQLEPNHQEAVKTIFAEAEKLGHILSSLLGLAQTGFNGKKQNWESIRIDELVVSVAEAVKKIESESKINLDFSGLPDNESMMYTEGNLNLLQLAISNIVLNACKYSNNSPVVIRVSSAGNRITIAVSDQGIGIPEEDQSHIFEPFFRASNTTDFQGYGIGLPLTLNIIRLHKGTIGIRSEEQVGTEIQILLPIQQLGTTEVSL
ncbi:HAMP domain-containing histidine kinase [Pedobacter sp. MC2016-14]|uniref:HAMP domain-containing sensor histidine kinase n=1 Tax=Pedobacter sp. MC2016-14 TaxID=2897327 RepID=UPI001E40FDA5|nr:HAMP domain-containing sensor histidine kinase [Pedobacter sp. MC2016-14]MCD0488801.1 HAMP domain-containing histidine kinase [Pedobacter sp. MC2016-14]